MSDLQIQFRNENPDVNELNNESYPRWLEQKLKALQEKCDKLEALNKAGETTTKNCGDCKHWDGYQGNKGLCTDDTVSIGHTARDFGCKHWIPKWIDGELNQEPPQERKTEALGEN